MFLFLKKQNIRPYLHECSAGIENLLSPVCLPDWIRQIYFNLTSILTMTLRNSFFFFFIFTGSLSAQSDSTRLPIFIIDTQGKTILDDPKIMVSMKVINNGPGKMNHPSDPPNEFDGLIGIEYRGSSSQMFPKKPFGFEVWDENGEDIKAGFFGMPRESDWILYPSYNEKSFMRNVLTMDIARKMGMYASRTKYVELILNGSYEGIYILMEKIKRDKDRVNITKLEPKSVSGDELTGGYIIKLDKETGTNLGSWKSKYANPRNPASFSTYLYEAPKDITAVQKKYISEYVMKIEDLLQSPAYTDPELGYAKYIDMTSFIRMFIINEVSRNMDAYRISAFFYKDVDSKGGKLTMGPPWDYDIAYGNCEYCEGWRYDRFAFRYNDICSDDYWLVPFWWEKLISDPAFVGPMRKEYFRLREKGNALDFDEISKNIDRWAEEINEAQKRNFRRWPILGQYIWPNPKPVPSSWELEVLGLKDWIAQRLQWLDRNLPAEYTSVEEPSESISLTAYPNPFIDTIGLRFHSARSGISSVEFTDLQGRLLYSARLETHSGFNVFNISMKDNPGLNGPHLLRVVTPDARTVVRKMVKAP